MTREEFFKRLEALHKAELDLVRVKNKDYGADEDPFANFRWFGELGFLVRMSDKFMRAKQILESGQTSVKSESLKDTLMDLSNYANLLIIYLEDGKTPTHKG